MDFDVTDDQRALQDGVRQFCHDRFPTDVTRRFGEPGGFDRGAWQDLAALGTFGISLPEDAGGVGLAAIDAVLVYEVLGNALVPGPLVGSALAAAALPPDAAAAVLDGRVVATAVELAANEHAPLLVEHLPDADVLLVVGHAGVRQMEVASVKAERAERSLDPATPVSVVTDLPPGEPIAGPEEAARLRTLGSLLTSALLVGIAGATADLAVAYAKDRHQFGRPIGSFQALQHMLADAHARREVARASVHAAGVIVDEPDIGDIDRAVAGARVLAAHAASDNASTCIQVHGGIGFTWEFDAHLYLKRAWTLTTAFGSPDEAAEIVAQRLVAMAPGPVSLDQEST